MRILFLVSVFLLTLTSCKEALIGLCDSPFETKVGQPITEGEYKVYLVSVKNQYKWWLSSISVNGSTNSERLGKEVLKDQFVLEHEKYIFEKVDNSSIKVKVKASELNERFKLFVTIQSGNCFDGFNIEF